MGSLLFIFRVEGVKMKAIEAWSKSNVAKLSSQEGVSNLTDAGESLNRTREMLDRMAALIMVDGMKALNASILSANSTGDLAKRLAEMAAEVFIPYIVFIYSTKSKIFLYLYKLRLQSI